MDLITFRDPDGRDLPDAPRPDPDTPAPPRFLYDVDNLLLSHADRTRVVTPEATQQDYGTNIQPCLLLVDGFTAAEWKLTRSGGKATLTIRPFTRLSTKDTTALTAEGARLLDFAAPDDTHDIRVVSAT